MGASGGPPAEEEPAPTVVTTQTSGSGRRSAAPPASHFAAVALPPPASHVAAVALLAGGGIAYEIALTRLLSALLAYAWVAPVLAVALLGVGLGAALVTASPRLRAPTAAQAFAGLAAVSAVLALPAWLWAVASSTPLLGLAMPLVAYTCLGAATAAVLSWHPPSAASLLRADYGAAAVAAAVTPWLLSTLGLGVPGTMVLIALAPGLAAVALWRSGSREIPGGPALGSNAALAASLLGLAAVPLGVLALAVGSLSVDPAAHMSSKPVSLALARGGTVVTTRWDATARTDLIRTPDGARYLYMDGGAGSLVATSDPAAWWTDVGAFAFAIAPAESAFLIGPGGGLDVAQARAHGVERVTAVEVNAASVDLVRRLGAATGRVYDDSTRVVIGDGRRVLAQGDEAYDVITLANVVTGAAELRGAALTESLVYTVEAFREYLSHLEPDGRLALKLYDELTLTRALATALAALVSGGYAENEAAAMSHLFAVLDVSDSAAVPLLVVRRKSFTPQEAVSAARVAEARGWSLLLVPGLLTPPPLRPLAEGRSDLGELVAATDADIAPTHDASPYFFSFEPGVPRPVRRLGIVAVVALALLVAGALMVGRSGGKGVARWPLYLGAVWLGAGFLLVELAALPTLQRTIGQPAWSLSAALGAVLLGGAVGAALAARTRPGGTATAAGGSRREIAGPALLAAATVGSWSLVAPWLHERLAATPPAVSGAVLTAALALAAVPMGLPFPRLLRTLGSPPGVAIALALSGFAAVVAGAAAGWLSHAAGTPAVAAAAAIAYLLAAASVAARARTAGSP